MFHQRLHLFVEWTVAELEVQGFEAHLWADLLVCPRQNGDLLHSLRLDGPQSEQVVAKLLVHLKEGQVGKLVGADLLVDEDAKLFDQLGALEFSSLYFLKKNRKLVMNVTK